MKVDFIIVGQGLAGSLIAWQLLERGQQVLVVDRDELVTSSKIAAGVISPITGTRVAPSWRVDDFLPFAHDFYWSLEEKLGLKLFHHTRIARLFDEQEQIATWEKRRSDEALAEFIETSPFQINSDNFRAEHGGFEMKQAGWLDVSAFLEATRMHLLGRLGYAIAKLDPADVKIAPEGGVVWKNVIARRGIIFCQGWEGNQNPFFDWMPMRPTKGEILEIECENPIEENRIVSRNGWLLPLGGGKFRAGSNYDHDFENPAPSETGKAAVLEKIRSTLTCDFTVTRHRAAIRPVIDRSKPFIGRHPRHDQVAFFNGLGSKGVLNGPLAAAQLADHLVNDVPIEEELDIRSNF